MNEATLEKHAVPTIEMESYTPNPGFQQDFHIAVEEYQYILLIGGIRSGKSRAAFEQDIDLCQRYPGNIGLITRYYQEDLNSVTKPEFYRVCPPDLIDHTDKDSCYFKNGSKIIFKGLYSHQSGRISRLGSLEVGFFHCEEGQEITEYDFHTLQGRLSLKVPMTRGYLTGNPPDVTHWLYTYFEDSKNKKIATVIHADTHENITLPPDYITMLESDYKDNPALFDRFITGNWGFTPKGTPAFKASEANFGTFVYDPDIELIRGWDFGWVHPAVGWLQIDSDSAVTILLEDLGSKVYLEDYKPHIINKTRASFPEIGLKEIEDYCDPAGIATTDTGRSSVKILGEPPDQIFPRYRKSNPDDRAELIQALLSREARPGVPMLRIDNRCKFLKEAILGGYSRDAKGVIKDGFYEHIIDAVGYALEMKLRNVIAGRKEGQVRRTLTRPNYKDGYQTKHEVPREVAATRYLRDGEKAPERNPVNQGLGKVVRSGIRRTANNYR